MIYCTNCGKQNTKRFDDQDGHPYQLEDNLNDWGDYYKGEHNIVTYTAFICNDCGNFFALGELDPRAKFPKNGGVSYTVSLDIDTDKILKEVIDDLKKTSPTKTDTASSDTRIKGP